MKFDKKLTKMIRSLGNRKVLAALGFRDADVETYEPCAVYAARTAFVFSRLPRDLFLREESTLVREALLKPLAPPAFERFALVSSFQKINT